MQPIRLTKRQHEIMMMVADGKSASVIGQLLGISEHTVNFHTKAVLAKLGCVTRTNAVALLIWSGALQWVPDELRNRPAEVV